MYVQCSLHYTQRLSMTQHKYRFTHMYQHFLTKNYIIKFFFNKQIGDLKIDKSFNNQLTKSKNSIDKKTEKFIYY